ncbi:MAG: glycosyltransferase [Thermoplasmatota archaeon]
MKAYFSVIGIGLGHASRCISIAEELGKEGVECVFSTYGKAAKIAEKEGFRTYRSKPLMWYEDEKGHVDFEKTILKSPIIFYRMIQHFKDEKKRIEMENPDVIISDSRYAIIPASKYSGAPRIYITNQPKVYMPRPTKGTNGGLEGFNPLEKLGQWWNYKLLSGHDKILLPDFPMPNSISYRHMRMDDAPEVFKNKTEFVGPIAPHRPNGYATDHVKEVCQKYEVEPDEFIYISFSGPGTVKKDIHDAIFELFDDYDLPAIMGSGKPGEFKIHNRGDLKIVDGWIDEKDRESLLEGAKLVISRAGLCTLSEIAAFGKKAIVIPQPNQPEQETNARGIEKFGLAKKIEPYEITAEILDKRIKELLNSSKACTDAERCKEMTESWLGEEKSADIIMDMLENGVKNS